MSYGFSPQRVKQYAISALLVIAASGLTIAISPFFGGKAPLFFFTIAVLLAAGYGGTFQGLLATALSLGVTLLLFRDHIVMLLLAQSSLTLFGVVGVAVSIVLGKLHRTNQALCQTRDELYRANERLADHTEALAYSNEEFQRFAYLVAHDLKAPLRAINTAIQSCLNRAGAVSQESREPLAQAISRANGMNQLIDDLLTLAAVPHQQENSGAEVDLTRVIEVALQNLRAEIDGSGAEITIDPLPVLWAHEGQLLRLFQNLLSNALKYRSDRKPDIRISATLVEEDEWRFVVTDNGIGIDPEYYAKVFEPFQRLHSAAEYDGSGLGLAICTRIVEQHTGRIWLESDPGKGSRFYFTLRAKMKRVTLKKAPPSTANVGAARNGSGA